MNILGAFGPTDLQVAVRIGVVLAFSSTIVVIKILQDRGDEQSLYGNICVGILIMQDIAAVIFISILRGEAPSAWSLSLVVVIPLLMV
ncbi:cation:proton antiporter domain-containing protein, partial [Brevibacterium paucivorans]|uniref:cation:proton antiporter domain-containing protein n=1 Tax=Brevibacterium paucivorans TaxID=170994 RepID=UPI002155E70E